MNYAQAVWIVINEEMLSAVLGLTVVDFKQTLHVHGLLSKFSADFRNTAFFRSTI